LDEDGTGIVLSKEEYNTRVDENKIRNEQGVNPRQLKKGMKTLIFILYFMSACYTNNTQEKKFKFDLWDYNSSMAY